MIMLVLFEYEDNTNRHANLIQHCTKRICQFCTALNRKYTYLF